MQWNLPNQVGINSSEAALPQNRKRSYWPAAQAVILNHGLENSDNQVGKRGEGETGLADGFRLLRFSSVALRVTT